MARLFEWATVTILLVINPGTAPDRIHLRTVASSKEYQQRDSINKAPHSPYSIGRVKRIMDPEDERVDYSDHTPRLACI